MKRTYLLLAAAAMSFAACKSNIEPETPSKGDADFTTYVAIGNSLTAGFADGTLYRSGQINSYPSMLSQQFKLVGGGDFKQPLLPGEAGWPIAPAAGFFPKRELGYTKDCLGVTSLGPVLYTGSWGDTTGSATNIAVSGPYNNVGIPGIKCVHYGVAGYGLLNPYAGRFFSNPGTQKPMDVALQLKATFFSVWLGSNDVLAYATSGGEGAVDGIGANDISPLAAFKATYDALIGQLVANGAGGVLINIPDVTSVPYFTTINPKGLNLTAAQAQGLTAAYAALGITFTEGPNYFIIADPAAPGGMRKMTAGEYIVLTTPGDSLKCGGWGSTKPIPTRYVLTAAEVANVKTATNAFNAVIAENATKYDLALMDANTYLSSLSSGITWDGVTYSPAFVSGGAFSLDGVHLTPRGYALVANEILRVVNARYHATVPSVEINKYGGIKFP
jgi:lysophospholipase L1-like esterase